jgi:hypothetical protein
VRGRGREGGRETERGRGRESVVCGVCVMYIDVNSGAHVFIMGVTCTYLCVGTFANVNVDTYICIIHTRIHADTYTCVHACTHTYIHVHTAIVVCLLLHTYAHSHTNTNTFSKSFREELRVFLIYIHTYIHTYDKYKCLLT